MLDAILGASDPDVARRALEHRYGFTEMQAWAVMDVQFRRKTAMDRKKIERGRREFAARVADLEEEVDGA